MSKDTGTQEENASQHRQPCIHVTSKELYTYLPKAYFDFFFSCSFSERWEKKRNKA